MGCSGRFRDLTRTWCETDRLKHPVSLLLSLHTSQKLDRTVYVPSTVVCRYASFYAPPVQQRNRIDVVLCNLRGIRNCHEPCSVKCTYVPRRL